MPPTFSRDRAARRESRTSSRIRPRLTISSTATFPRVSRSKPRRRSHERPGGVRRALAGVDGRACPRHAGPGRGRRGRLRLRKQHPRPGVRGGWRTRPHFPASCRPTSARSSAGARAVPLGRAFRRSGGHRRHRRGGAGLFPEDRVLARWLRMAEERIDFQGLPARICWLGYGERARVGLAFNDWCAAAR